MLGVRTLALLCFVGGALSVPTLQLTVRDISCPDQNENSTEVLFANPANCSTFYECDNGIPKLLVCPTGTFFSSKDHVCTYQQDSDCPVSRELFSLTLDDGDDSQNFTCPDEPDNTTSTYYPNLNNCSTFYECSNEKPVLLDCPKNLYFNAKLCVCTLPKRSGCTQPDDDGDDGVAVFEDDVNGIMSDGVWLEMSEHMEKVYSGKCKKEEL